MGAARGLSPPCCSPPRSAPLQFPRGPPPPPRGVPSTHAARQMRGMCSERRRPEGAGGIPIGKRRKLDHVLASNPKGNRTEAEQRSNTGWLPMMDNSSDAKPNHRRPSGTGPTEFKCNRFEPSICNRPSAISCRENGKEMCAAHQPSPPHRNPPQ